MTYSHRNGETTPPSVGVWYWFWGRVIKPGQTRGSRRMTIVRCYPGGFIVDGKYFRFAEIQFDGRWWGEIVPPWKDAQP